MVRHDESACAGHGVRVGSLDAGDGRSEGVVVEEGEGMNGLGGDDRGGLRLSWSGRKNNEGAGDHNKRGGAKGRGRADG